MAARKARNAIAERYFSITASKDFISTSPENIGFVRRTKGLGDMLIPSNTHRIRVGVPQTSEANRKAQDYFSDAVGLTQYLQGSRSPYLKNGVMVLEGIANEFKDSALGAKVAVALAHGVARPFYRVEGAAEPKLIETAKADPKQALQLTDPALQLLEKTHDKSTNLAYARVVRRRAEYHVAAGQPDRARQEVAKLRSDLAARGANAPVLQLYGNLETSLGTSPQPPDVRRKGRAKSITITGTTSGGTEPPVPRPRGSGRKKRT
jgi:hypothetical protein